MVLSARIAILMAAGMLAINGGCKKEEPAPMDEATRTRVQAILARADALDGKTDKVVSKCAGCALGMNGKSQHATETAGYTMHFCAAGCKDHFSEKLSDNILAMSVPDTDGD